MVDRVVWRSLPAVTKSLTARSASAVCGIPTFPGAGELDGGDLDVTDDFGDRRRRRQLLASNVEVRHGLGGGLLRGNQVGEIVFQRADRLVQDVQEFAAPGGASGGADVLGPGPRVGAELDPQGELRAGAHCGSLADVGGEVVGETHRGQDRGDGFGRDE